MAHKGHHGQQAGQWRHLVERAVKPAEAAQLFHGLASIAVRLISDRGLRVTGGGNSTTHRNGLKARSCCRLLARSRVRVPLRFFVDVVERGCYWSTPSPPSEALPQPSDSHLVSIGESTRPLVPAFCFAPLPVPLQALGLDIRYDNESRHYYVAEATLEKVLEQCNAKRQECERHGLLSPAHKVTLPREAREAFKHAYEKALAADGSPASGQVLSSS